MVFLASYTYMRPPPLRFFNDLSGKDVTYRYWLGRRDCLLSASLVALRLPLASTGTMSLPIPTRGRGRWRCYRPSTRRLCLVTSSEMEERFGYLYAFNRCHRNRRTTPATMATTYSPTGAYRSTTSHCEPSHHPKPALHQNYNRYKER